MTKQELPDWLTRRADGVFVADADLFYPAYLNELGVEMPDQYWLEIAYIFMKLDAQKAIHAAGFGVEETGENIKLTVSGPASAKEKWRQTAHPAGKGAAGAYVRVPPYGDTVARTLYLELRNGHPYMHLRPGQTWGAA